MNNELDLCFILVHQSARDSDKNIAVIRVRNYSFAAVKIYLHEVYGVAFKQLSQTVTG